MEEKRLGKGGKEKGRQEGENRKIKMGRRRKEGSFFELTSSCEALDTHLLLSLPGVVESQPTNALSSQKCLSLSNQASCQAASPSARSLGQIYQCLPTLTTSSCLCGPT